MRSLAGRIVFPPLRLPAPDASVACLEEGAGHAGAGVAMEGRFPLAGACIHFLGCQAMRTRGPLVP